ncbi:HNH endonuclease [Arcicella aurantiaca]|uniref:HNH endonuclease n=1 Tax=Arcicella aurantiaca TaxID=591202 RepID=A0A316DLL0_9BACT|nr:HNH endonuclease signature motif containing protein [Arcicella aurantiaca]PWK18775.1 HNH endonuclease [Arcicella aurantiaca]
MSRYISELHRSFVIKRATQCCEYCHLEDDVNYIPHQIDHIISLKHGGKTELENLAYSCFSCNNNKGSDIGTMLLPNMEFIRLFNPRLDNWNEHFELAYGVIYPLTSIGEETIKLLKMNTVEKIMERNV